MPASTGLAPPREGRYKPACAFFQTSLLGDLFRAHSLFLGAGKIMRKLFWCGVVAAVCLAAGTYFAADFAQRHPNSVLGTCTVTAHQVARQCSPLFVLSRAGMVSTHPS